MINAITDIPFELDEKTLAAKARVKPGTVDATDFFALTAQVKEIGRPKAIYRQTYIESREGDTVTIEGVPFQSRVLRSNLDDVERVFPYVVTCGAEVDELIEIPDGNFLMDYWLDTIKEALLDAGYRHLEDLLKHRYSLGQTSTMSPGGVDAFVWPIEQQGELFSLLGNTEDLIGVELTDSFLMRPNKSLSGIRFQTEIDYQSCRLCPREGCPRRSAAFDAHLRRSLT